MLQKFKNYHLEKNYYMTNQNAKDFYYLQCILIEALYKNNYINVVFLSMTSEYIP